MFFFSRNNEWCEYGGFKNGKTALFQISVFMFYSHSLSCQASLLQQKCKEHMLLCRIRNLVDNSLKKRKLIKELETNNKAVKAEAIWIMEKKAKRITELEAVIREYKETLSNKDKHIAEVKEQL